MNSRLMLVVAIAIAAGGLTLGTFLGPRGRAEDKEKPAAAAGRYQAVEVDKGSLVVMDTATGECWENHGTGWIEWGTPVKKK
jgi:hypothetical protein